MEEPTKESTVHEFPPDVGGVVPDSKPPSFMTVVGQVLGVGVARERVNRAEKMIASCILLDGIGRSTKEVFVDS